MMSRMESQANMDDDFLGGQQCQEREGDGYQCELPADHIGDIPCACPVAMNNWLRSRHGTSACQSRGSSDGDQG